MGILMEQESCSEDPCRGGVLFSGSLWSRRVVLVIPAKENSCSGDAHGAGEWLWCCW